MRALLNSSNFLKRFIIHTPNFGSLFSLRSCISIHRVPIHIQELIGAESAGRFYNKRSKANFRLCDGFETNQTQPNLAV